MRENNITNLNKTDIKEISSDFGKAGLQAYSGQAAFFLMLSFFSVYDVFLCTAGFNSADTAAVFFLDYDNCSGILLGTVIRFRKRHL